MSRWLPLSLVLFVLAAPCDAEAPRIDRIEIVEWGIYRVDRVAEIPSPLSPSGKEYLATNIRIQQTTTTIPALVGMTFGFRFRAVGSPPGAKLSLKSVVRLPKQGVTNPAKGKTYFGAEYDLYAVVGELRFEGNTLDPDWLVEPGPWTMEIWHAGRKLAEKVFMVTRLVSSAE